MKDGNTPSRAGLPRLTLAVEFDESVFDAVVQRHGIEVWNEWMQRLFNDRATMATWMHGGPPPSVSVFFKFKADLRDRFPHGEFRPAWFLTDEGKEQEGMPELFVLPVEEFPLAAKVTCMVDRS